MKFAASRPFANADIAARKLVEIANNVEAVQDGRIYPAPSAGSTSPLTGSVMCTFAQAARS